MQKLFLFLLAFLAFACSNAVQFQIPISKEPMNLMKFKNFMEKIRLAKENPVKRKNGRFLDTQFPGDYFVTQIGLGTPPQNFTLEVDTDVGMLAVLGKNYTNATKFEHRYDPDLSSTGKYNDSTFMFNYESGYLNGVLYQDVFRIGNYSYDTQLFGSIYEIGDPTGVYPTDGVLGLNWSTNATEEYEPYFDPPVEHIGSELSQKIYTIYVSPYKEEKLKSGVITFGALDTENCGSFTFFPLKKFEFVVRAFTVDSFAVSKYQKTYRGTDHGLYNSGYATLRVPADEFSKILRYVEVGYDFETNLYTLPCNQTAKNPDLIWNLGGSGQDFAVPSTAYTVDIGLSNGKCALAADMFTPFFSETSLILGDPFVQTWCAAFDFGQNQLGLAKAVQK